MYWRVYLNQRAGNDHARVVDFEADDEPAARAAGHKLAKGGEVVDQIVRIHLEEHPPEETTRVRDRSLDAHLTGAS